MSELNDLRNEIRKEGILLTDEEIKKIILLVNKYNNTPTNHEIEKLKDEIYQLSVEKSKYQFLLTQRFHDRNNQTIAYQFGRLVLDFLKNPIRNFITPNDLLSIYTIFLKRKEKKSQLNYLEKKCVQWFYNDENINNISNTFESLVNEKTNKTTLQPVEKVQTPTTPVKVKAKRPLKVNFSHKKAKDLKVAIILDEFSFNSFKDEFIPLIITPNNWKLVFTQQSPDLFFCESAWSGTDSTTRPWKGKIYASRNFTKENRTVLLEILNYCNENGIPTIFWNKEDPTHYTDRIHDFVKTAQLFDFVFTTAQECVEQYKTEYNLKHVYALPFATNPKLFNPIDEKPNSRTENIVFAGSWYANHIERSKTMHQLFDSLIQDKYQIEFYNRYYGDDDPNHLIPDQYQQYVKPNISNKEIGKVYKSSIYGLNLNTVVDSETMFARRVFELMSSNTLVLSNYSKGMDNMFGNNVIFLDKNPKGLSYLNKETIERIREENLQNVLKNHTYKKRFETILQAVGVTYNTEPTKVTVVVKVDNRFQLEKEIGLFKQHFNYIQYKLLIVLSEKVPDLDCAELYAEFNYQEINLIAESYINQYSTAKSKYLDTASFLLTDSIANLDITIIDKALLHQSYITEDYISLIPHLEHKYIFEQQFKMINILAPADKFIESLDYINQNVELPIYYIEKQEKDKNGY